MNWKETFDALEKIQYKGALTIEAFGLALPELATATKILRRMSPEGATQESPGGKPWEQTQRNGEALKGRRSGFGLKVCRITKTHLQL